MAKRVRNQIRRRLLQVCSKSPRLGVLGEALSTYCAAVEGESNGDFRSNGEARLLRKLAPHCRVVIDGGACVGDWSRMALEINPRLELHAIEPLLKNYECMKNDLGLRTASVHRLALGDEDGQLQMDAQTQSIHRDVSGRTETVEVQTLDTFCQAQSIEFIDFLKLDVEGHELAALRGAKALLEASRIQHIQFEYGPEHVFARVQLRDIMGFLKVYGFRFYKLVPSGLVEVPEYTTWLENYRYKNFYAVLERV